MEDCLFCHILRAIPPEDADIFLEIFHIYIYYIKSEAHGTEKAATRLINSTRCKRVEKRALGFFCRTFLWKICQKVIKTPVAVGKLDHLKNTHFNPGFTPLSDPTIHCQGPKCATSCSAVEMLQRIATLPPGVLSSVMSSYWCRRGDSSRPIHVIAELARRLFARDWESSEGNGSAVIKQTQFSYTLFTLPRIRPSFWRNLGDCGGGIVSAETVCSAQHGDDLQFSSQQYC